MGLIGPGARAGEVSEALPSVWLESMTSVELRQRLDRGEVHTAIVPVGGTEQTGPHLTLGKHNARVAALSQSIAQKMGQTVVAPVMAYVPEGQISPATGHMRWSGTLSVPVPVFEGLVEAAARSLCAHGLRTVVLLGDHGDYQSSLTRVAQKLKPTGTGKCRVLAITAYYRAAVDDAHALLKAQGFSDAEIGQHGGVADTALSMALAPSTVRPQALAQAAAAGVRGGVTGDPRRATAELGRQLALKIEERTLQALRQAP